MVLGSLQAVELVLVQVDLEVALVWVLLLVVSVLLLVVLVLVLSQLRPSLPPQSPQRLVVFDLVHWIRLLKVWVKMKYVLRAREGGCAAGAAFPGIAIHRGLVGMISWRLSSNRRRRNSGSSTWRRREMLWGAEGRDTVELVL